MVAATRFDDPMEAAAAGAKDAVEAAATRAKDAVKAAGAGEKKTRTLSSTKAAIVAGDPKRLPRPPVAKPADPKRRRLQGGRNIIQSLGLVHYTSLHLIYFVVYYLLCYLF